MSTRSGNAVRLAVLLLAAMAAQGCSEEVHNFFKTDKDRFMNPTMVVRRTAKTSVSSILPTLGSADETHVLPPGATYPTADDHVYTDIDYQIGPTDILDISILDLFRDGQETLLRREVSDTGKIDLPLLEERILAEGLAKEQLKDAIVDAYSPNVLRDPTVSVTIIARRQSVFSVLGAVDRPGTYNVRRKGMRLLEALAQGGGITQSNIKYIYVIRHQPAKRITPEGQERTEDQELPALPDLPDLPDLPEDGNAATPPEDANAPKADTDELEKRLRELGLPLEGEEDGTAPIALNETEESPKPKLEDAASNPRWLQSGQGPIRVEAVDPNAVNGRQADYERSRKDPYGWGDAAQITMGRVIAVNRQKLENGDPMMNIVIRDNDVVQVPPLEIGEFYVTGEVPRPGVYSLTGRNVTVKQAISAAGGFAQLAFPENTILVRRVGENQEQITPINVQKIFSGEHPDVMLKKDDVIAVGSDVKAPFMAVIRNAFRMTYGMGFIYDRNLAFPLTNATSRRFTRW